MDKDADYLQICRYKGLDEALEEFFNALDKVKVVWVDDTMSWKGIIMSFNDIPPFNLSSELYSHC